MEGGREGGREGGSNLLLGTEGLAAVSSLGRHGPHAAHQLQHPHADHGTGGAVILHAHLKLLAAFGGKDRLNALGVRDCLDQCVARGVGHTQARVGTCAHER
jgi:hypothetical protein